MSHEPTARDVEALLAFLPVFREPGFRPVSGSGGGTPTADGAVLTAWPIYHDAVVRFFALAGQPCWSDYEYRPAEVGRMVDDPERVARATLAEIRSMLTWCVRGERFSDGHWGAVVSDGRLTRVLERLEGLALEGG